MQTEQLLATLKDECCKQINSLPGRLGLPLLKVELQHENLNSESYRLECSGGVVTVSGCTPIALSYGLCDAAMAVRSCHIIDALGVKEPKFRLRPLWLGVHCKVQLSPLIAIYLPKQLINALRDENACLLLFSKRIIHGGFNSLILGLLDVRLSSQVSLENITLSAPELEKLNSIFQSLQTAGIKLIFKPEFAFSHAHEACLKSPYDPAFRISVKSLFEDFFSLIPIESVIFWESMLLGSNYRAHSQAQVATELEVVIEELHMVEEALKMNSKLIFFIPAARGTTASKHARWFPVLIDEMGAFTIFAFSAVAGDVCDDQAPDHPFWDILRRGLDVSATPLMPILNVGLIHQGEGLWPTCNADLIERFIPRCTNHHFAGVISVWNLLPAAGSFHDCNYWVAGKSLWNHQPPFLLSETWFAAYNRKDEHSQLWEAMKKARAIAFALGHLRHKASDMGRALWHCQESCSLAESLIAQLKGLKIAMVAKPHRNAPSQPFVDLFPFFIADIARFLHHLMPTLSISSFQALNIDIDGFWSLKKEGKNATSDASFPSEPFSGPSGSLMEKLFKENRL